MLPDDPDVGEQEGMMNAQAWVWQAELDDSMQFIFNNGKVIGIWLTAFPTNARKRTVLHLFCAKEQRREPNMETVIEAAVDKIYEDAYDILRNTTKGGFNVILR